MKEKEGKMQSKSEKKTNKSDRIYEECINFNAITSLL